MPLLLALAACILKPIVADPHPVVPSPTPGVKEASLGSVNAEAAAALQVHPLHIGDTQSTYGQLFEGQLGLTGRRGLIRSLTDDRAVRVPVYAFLVLHPTEGAVLIDTGLGFEQRDPEAYYTKAAGGRTFRVWKDIPNALPADQELEAHLSRFKLKPADIKHVVITHMHEDHVGNLPRLGHAEVHLGRLEHEDRDRMGFAPTWSGVKSWTPVDYDDGVIAGFSGHEDLFGDGTVLLLPTPGHTLGHTSVLLNLGDHQALLPGDTAYTTRSLDSQTLAGFNTFGDDAFEVQADSNRRIWEAFDSLPDLVILPSHDPFTYAARMETAFADGRADPAEVAILRESVDQLYDLEGRLREEALPVFIEVTGKAGEVGSALP